MCELACRPCLAVQSSNAEDRPDRSGREKYQGGPGQRIVQVRGGPVDNEAIHRDGEEPAAKDPEQQVGGERDAEQEEEAAVRAVELHRVSFNNFRSRRSTLGSARASSTNWAIAASPKSRITSRTAIE